MTNTLTIGADTFTYLIIGNFTALTPDYVDDKKGVLDGELLDAVMLDGSSDED